METKLHWLLISILLPLSIGGISGWGGVRWALRQQKTVNEGLKLADKELEVRVRKTEVACAVSEEIEKMSFETLKTIQAKQDKLEESMTNIFNLLGKIEGKLSAHTLDSAK